MTIQEKSRMLHEQTHEKLIAMKLFGMATALKDRLERRDHQDLCKPEFFGLLVDDEWLYRENRKLTARLKLAKFKQRSAASKTSTTPPLGACAKIRCSNWHKTAGSRPMNRCSSLAPPAPGKSFIAQAFGLNACRSGFTVQYLRMPTLLTLFVQARAQGTYDRLAQALGQNRTC